MKLKKILTPRIFFGIAGLLISGILIFYFKDLYSFFVEYTIKSLSKDHEINAVTRFKLAATLGFIILFFFTSGIFILFRIPDKLISFLKKTISFEEIKNFFLDDPIGDKKTYHFYAAVLGPLIGFLLYFYYMFTGKAENEGIMEYLTSYLFLFSIIILVVAGFNINKLNKPLLTRKKIIIFLVVITSCITIYYGEEISWGQQIFHWKAEGVFVEYNFQKETNLHNFFNPIFRYLYPIAGMSVFMVLFFLWQFSVKNSNYIFALFIPHRSLFFLIFLLACTTFLDYREISEEIFSLFCLFYSIRIFMCIKYPPKAFI
jgi:hypothetical protein